MPFYDYFHHVKTESEKNSVLISEEATYAAIFKSSSESIFIVGSQGHILRSNPRSEDLFGYDRSEMQGLKIEALIPARFHKDHKRHRQQYAKNSQPRIMGVGRHLVAKKKDGTEFPIEVSLNPAEINGEKVFIAFLIDITQRHEMEQALKKSEEQLIEYAAELERRVQERTQQLADSVKKLEQEVKERKKAEEESKEALKRAQELNELKSRFVSMASHEFRTPLSTILSSVSLIGKYTAPGTETKRLKHIERIKSNVGDLTGILNDFLSLDKLDAGKVAYNPQIVDIVSFIYDLLEELNLILKKDQVVNFHTELPVLQLEIDPQMLKNIVLNLTSNAIKYSPENSPIDLTLTEEEKQVSLEIRDYGIGIPEEDCKHLFERFFRAHNTTNIQGTGLGLNLVKRYIDLLKGSIEFDSTVGEGSVFTIHLPKNL